MKPEILASITATLLFSAGVSGRANDCRGDILYCGKTLRNMGWTTYNIWTWLEGNYPRPGRDDQYDNLLFQCLENSVNRDTLNYRVSCTKGCVDAGAGKNDYCR